MENSKRKTQNVVLFHMKNQCFKIFIAMRIIIDFLFLFFLIQILIKFFRSNFDSYN